jgi:hypothetical protein
MNFLKNENILCIFAYAEMRDSFLFPLSYQDLSLAFLLLIKRMLVFAWTGEKT